MSLFIQTNTAALFAQNRMASTEVSRAQSFQRLASGFRINGAADDAAGLGISKNMDAQIKSFAVAERNANDGISMAQTADGAAEAVSNLLTRMRELAVQANNGSLSTNDQTNLDTEYQSILSEIDRTAAVSTFNTKNLLSGAAAGVKFQVGIGTTSNDAITVTFGGADTTQLGVSGTSVTAGNASGAITAIDTAIQNLATVREGFGSAMNRLQSTVANLQTVQTNMSSSLSRIRDVDVASESSNLARQQVLAQAGASVLAQANQAPQLALQLLQH